jgi:glucokinase
MKKVKGNLPVLAIDLGGTKIIAAIVSHQGQVMAKEYHPTLAKEGPSSVINRMCLAIDHLFEARSIDLSQLHSISIAAAGAIDFDRGVVTSSPNLPGWHDVPLRDIVSSKYKVNTCLINDASAGALGEHEFGAGRGVNNLIFLTVGTGIGGGIIINGRLYLGPSGSAGEIGHITIDVNGPRCSCGNTGCLETLASGTAIAREAIRRIGRGERSVLADMVEGEIENITAELVGMAAQGGDSLAREVISQAATYLGVGMVSLVNIFNPEMIIVGGGVMQMADLLLEPARQVVKERAFSLAAQAVRIVPTQLGGEAVVLGAAVFAYGQAG